MIAQVHFDKLICSKKEIRFEYERLQQNSEVHIEVQNYTRMHISAAEQIHHSKISEFNFIKCS